MLKRFIPKKINKIFLASVFVGMIFVFLQPKSVSAAVGLDYVFSMDWVVDFFIGMLRLLFKLAIKFNEVAFWFLGVMMDPVYIKNMIKSDAVDMGWRVVRDFLNMFFVLLLLFTAISTILRIESFSAKKYFVKIILAAVLINFSKPITLAIIDVSQLAMNFFLNNIQVAESNYAAYLSQQVGLGEAYGAQQGETMEVMFSLVAGIIFVLVFSVMIFVLALSLLYRIVAFWVLTVLSPLAFFGMAMPTGLLGQATSTWVKKITHWAFYGPVLMFFLWLALIFVQNIKAANLGVAGSAGSNGIPSMIHTFSTDILNHFIPFAVAIYLLFYGYDLTKSFASATGSAMSNLMSKGQLWADKALRTGAGIGTLGVAPLAAGAYGMAQNRLKLEGAAFRAGMGSRVRKRFKIESADEKKARHAAWWGGESEQVKYERKKALEKVKDWELEGISDADLAKKRGSKDKIERKAAAMYDAKEGNFKNLESYEKAMDTLEGDESLKKKVRADAEKKNLKAVLDHDIKYKNPEQVKKFNEHIDAEINKRRAAVEANGGTYTARMAAAERNRLNTDDGFRDFVYKSKLDSMKLTDMEKQDATFHNSQELARYAAMQIAGGTDKRFTAKNLREFLGKGNLSGKHAKWEEWYRLAETTEAQRTRAQNTPPAGGGATPTP